MKEKISELTRLTNQYADKHALEGNPAQLLNVAYSDHDNVFISERNGMLLHYTNLLLQEMEKDPNCPREYKTQEFKDNVRIATILSDVGTILVEPEKAKKYSADLTEYTEMLGNEFKLPKEVLDMIRDHHDSVADKNISMGARILGTVDVYVMQLTRSSRNEGLRDSHERSMRTLEVDVKIGHKDAGVVEYLRAGIKRDTLIGSYDDAKVTRRALNAFRQGHKMTSPANVEKRLVDEQPKRTPRGGAGLRFA